MKIGWRKTPAKIQIKEFSKSYINLILETTIEMNRIGCKKPQFLRRKEGVDE
jgi:hypothetical protein